MGDVLPGSTDEVLTLKTARGPVILSATKIDVRAATLLAAYEARAKQATTEPQHLALGRWCLEQNLLTQAREQFAFLNSQLRTTALERVREQYEAPPTPELASVPPSTTAGLRPETRRGRAVAAGYRSHVRPLLLAGCGASNCHAARSQQSLHLLRGGLTDDRVTIEALLERIDRDDPLSSPLLDWAARPHGPIVGAAARRGAWPLSPVQSPARYERLRDWVVAAAAVEPEEIGAAAPVAVPVWVEERRQRSETGTRVENYRRERLR